MQDFVLEHVPHVILVAAAGQHSQTLEFYIHSMLGAVLNDNAKVLTGRSESGTITAFLADQTIAQLWETSAAARDELTDQPPLVRRAVAMARAAISGNLPVLCSLAGRAHHYITCPAQCKIPRMLMSMYGLHLVCHVKSCALLSACGFCAQQGSEWHGP